MQWLALEHPAQALAVQYFVKRIVSRHRPSQVHDVSIELSPVLEYRSIRVYDPRALIAPVNAPRIGRKMHDLLPAAYMEQVDRAVHQARTTREPVTCIYYSPGDATRQTTIIVPKPDIVIMTVDCLK